MLQAGVSFVPLAFSTSCTQKTEWLATRRITQIQQEPHQKQRMYLPKSDTVHIFIWYVNMMCTQYYSATSCFSFLFMFLQ